MAALLLCLFLIPAALFIAGVLGNIRSVKNNPHSHQFPRHVRVRQHPRIMAANYNWWFSLGRFIL
jgi:hypothetical protein